jgi:hypothetical protein
VITHEDGTREVAGGCTIRSDLDVEEFKAAEIDEVRGDMYISASGATSPIHVELTTVRLVRGLIVYNMFMETLALPDLAEVTERDVEVYQNCALTSLALPSLTKVGGDVIIRDNPLLPSTVVTDLLAQITVVGETSTEDTCPECCPTE